MGVECWFLGVWDWGVRFVGLVVLFGRGVLGCGFWILGYRSSIVGLGFWNSGCLDVWCLCFGVCVSGVGSCELGCGLGISYFRVLWS